MEAIFNSFEKSLSRFAEVLKAEKTLINRDAAIQRFEFTIELAWKVIQKFLRNQKVICRSPKECIAEAFKFGLIKDDIRWLAMLDDRNLTVHTYNEETAEQVYGRLPGYLELFNGLSQKLKTSEF